MNSGGAGRHAVLPGLERDLVLAAHKLLVARPPTSASRIGHTRRLPIGRYSVSLVAVDAAGNRAATLTRTFAITGKPARRARRT